jgi:DNA-directed RNA polymerase specialized sigma24 family protein
MDPLLREVLDATSVEQEEGALAVLVERHLLPLARAIVARKLRTYSGRTDRSDREDLVSETIMTLLERLRALKAGSAQPIENLSNYAATVVHSACAHYVRRRYPERARLKARLRYVLSTVAGLAIWTTDEGDAVCGRSEWAGRPVDPDDARRLPAIVERQSQPWPDLRPPALGRALHALLAEIGRPVPFEAIVAAIAAKAGLVEPTASVDPAALRSVSPPQDVALGERRLLADVWAEVRELPLGQRLALLLNLRGIGGAGVLWLLPIAGIATVRQIARVLEIPDGEFASLWQRIPLDDETIARRLGCTRQQVINLRMAGRKRLANRLRGRTTPLAPLSPQSANLRPDSSSLKGSV